MSTPTPSVPTFNFKEMTNGFTASPNFTALAPSTQDFYQSVIGTLIEIRAANQGHSPTEFLATVAATLDSRRTTGVGPFQYPDISCISFSKQAKMMPITYISHFFDLSLAINPAFCL